MPVIARRLVITGRVQGVFYRGWAVETAERLNLTGWVRNRIDGSVEAVAIGEPHAVEAFIARCREGPPASHVDGIIVSAIEP